MIHDVEHGVHGCLVSCGDLGSMCGGAATEGRLSDKRYVIEIEMVIVMIVIAMVMIVIVMMMMAIVVMMLMMIVIAMMR